MAKRKKASPSITPDSKIRSVLRGKLWLYSRERTTAKKKKDNTCEQCNKKGSAAKGKERKIEVHHKNAINWKKIFKAIRSELLVKPKYLEVLCKECHKVETKEQRRKK